VSEGEAKEAKPSQEDSQEKIKSARVLINIPPKKGGVELRIQPMTSLWGDIDQLCSREDFEENEFLGRAFVLNPTTPWLLSPGKGLYQGAADASIPQNEETTARRPAQQYLLIPQNEESAISTSTKKRTIPQNEESPTDMHGGKALAIPQNEEPSILAILNKSTKQYCPTEGSKKNGGGGQFDRAQQELWDRLFGRCGTALYRNGIEKGFWINLVRNAPEVLCGLLDDLEQLEKVDGPRENPAGWMRKRWKKHGYPGRGLLPVSVRPAKKRPLILAAKRKALRPVLQIFHLVQTLQGPCLAIRTTKRRIARMFLPCEPMPRPSEN
jgi:hypothetical protein